MRNIKCPLMHGEIEDAVCFDISMVAEGMAPESTAPKEVTQQLDYKNVFWPFKGFFDEIEVR